MNTCVGWAGWSNFCCSTTSTLSRILGSGRDTDRARYKNTVVLLGNNASFHFRSERYSFDGRDYCGTYR